MVLQQDILKLFEIKNASLCLKLRLKSQGVCTEQGGIWILHLPKNNKFFPYLLMTAVLHMNP